MLMLDLTFFIICSFKGFAGIDDSKGNFLYGESYGMRIMVEYVNLWKEIISSKVLQE